MSVEVANSSAMVMGGWSPAPFDPLLKHNAIAHCPDGIDPGGDLPNAVSYSNTSATNIAASTLGLAILPSVFNDSRHPVRSLRLIRVSNGGDAKGTLSQTPLLQTTQRLRI